MDLNLAEKTQRLIYLNRPYEAPLTRYIESTLRSGDGFIDVGAHQGYFSLLAGSRVGNSGGVLAIEALTRNAAQLQKNVSKSNLAHVVTTVRAAAGTARGNVLIHINPFNDGGATLSDLPTFSDNEEHVPKEAVYATRRPESLQELVPMARVDEQAAACSWHTKTRLVKIDVEGNELSALDSMSGLLERGIRPMIVCEVGSYTQAHSTWLTIHRYTVGKLRENGTVDLVTTPTEGAHGNFIFIPES
jgi:FkbM family methyltransferase